MDHYEVLGVAPDADPEEVRRAYLSSARLHHPDFHVSEAEADRSAHAARMKEITEAWHVLGDAGRRAEYDERQHRRRLGGPATERDRSHLDPNMPAGKGWTPRAGDDRWMDDYDGWVEERDRLLPDDDDHGPGRPNPAGVMTVGIFGLGVLVGFLGLVFESRAMLAGAVAAVVISSVLFVLLPLIQMTRRRPKPGTPSATRSRTPFSEGKG